MVTWKVGTDNPQYLLSALYGAIVYFTSSLAGYLAMSRDHPVQEKLLADRIS